MNHVPQGYQAVMPYLIINNAAAFIQFTQEVFNAEPTAKHMRDETIIMHGEIRIGGSIIMFADSTEQYSPATSHFFIYVENADATYALALEKGAAQVMPLASQSYGRSGGVKDPFGNTWWITSVQ